MTTALRQLIRALATLELEAAASWQAKRSDAKELAQLRCAAWFRLREAMAPGDLDRCYYAVLALCGRADRRRALAARPDASPATQRRLMRDLADARYDAFAAANDSRRGAA